MLMNKNILAGLADGLCFIGLGGVLGSPFVGLFIARISKGRTIREFIFWRISYSKFIWYFMVYCFLVIQQYG